MNLTFKRIYEDYTEKDGFRVLVDRLWARGISKEKARIDLWAKDITPTTALREAYHHQEIDVATFQARYEKELEENPQMENFINQIKNHEKTTLLSSVKDVQQSHIPVLLSFLKTKI